MCRELELHLAKKRPEWITKRHKYALAIDGPVVITLARRHLDALEYLQVVFACVRVYVCVCIYGCVRVCVGFFGSGCVCV